MTRVCVACNVNNETTVAVEELLNDINPEEGIVFCSRQWRKLWRGVCRIIALSID